MKVYESSKIRNIALLGHGGCGKTTLTESMLYISGATSRKGTVENGNTLSDFDTEEVKRGQSVRTALIPIEWKGYKLNVLDTPGSFDFVGGVQEALRVADAAVIMIRGSAGVEVGTEKAWEAVQEQGIPTMLFVSEMDAAHVDLDAILASCKEKFGNRIAPLHVPWYEKGQYIGYIHVAKMVARRFDKQTVVECPIPDGYEEAIDRVRTMILEAVAETDEALMEKYFADECITIQEIEAALKVGVMSGSIVPVLCGSALDGSGVRTLMDNIYRSFPSPLEGVRQVQPDAKPALFVFKTLVDPFIGKFSYFKVMGGSVQKDKVLMNKRLENTEKLAHLYCLRGKEQHEVACLHAGDIGAAAKLKEVATNDTLVTTLEQDASETIAFQQPYTKRALFAEGKGDEEKLSQALTKLSAEDKTFSTYYDEETHELVILGIGIQHLESIVSMLKDRFKVSVRLAIPTTRYRETIKGKMQTRGKYKKQSGGHGQYGDVVMTFEPSGDLQVPYTFEEKVFGGSVPKQYFPAVEKGLEECVQSGVLAGYPVVGLKAVLVDGSYHPVDSSEMAFKMATTVAFKEGVSKAMPILLEPIAQVEITVPEHYTGDVMGDMKKRRGRLIGMERRTVKQVIFAEVPMSELYVYPTDLKSMTQGRGELRYTFARYEEAPLEIQQKVITSHQK